MPAKNVVKIYVENGYYHIYNRGVEKRTTFEDDQDYKTFLKYLKEYLSNPKTIKKVKTSFTLQGLTFQGLEHQTKNYYKEIDLVTFCLMPNHFHLLIKVSGKDSLKGFMQALTTRYTIYFNRRYDRVGSLFQGTYKAILVTDEPYLLHLSRYIHLNPSEFTKDLTSAYSSYGDYLGIRNTEWIKPNIVLEQFNNKVGIEFKKINSYKDFVENYKQEDKLILGNYSID
jgi:putative transposase